MVVMSSVAGNYRRDKDGQYSGNEDGGLKNDRDQWFK